MPLPLTDPRWDELQSAYNGCEDVVKWLKEAYAKGSFSEGRLGDLINEVRHQGGTCEAMYAVATHLIELARNAPPKDALNLLIHAGDIYAQSSKGDVDQCPEFLYDDFVRCALEGAKMLSPLLRYAADFDTYKYGVAALAGFIGHHEFARFLDGLEFHQGQFEHVLLGGPFPKEE